MLATKQPRPQNSQNSTYSTVVVLWYSRPNHRDSQGELLLFDLLLVENISYSGEQEGKPTPYSKRESWATCVSLYRKFS